MQISRTITTSIRGAIHELLHPPKGQIPALDMLRALAVILVIAMHVGQAYVSGGGVENWVSSLPVVRGGWMGVDLFFVLSGYFIGNQLWREIRATNGIDFTAFIVRRGLRIWPLYFFTLFFVLAVLRRGGFPYGDWWTDPLFLTNYLNHGVVMGSWSLCVEEQFYVLAPLLLILATSRPVSFQRYRPFLLMLLAIMPMIRALIWWRLGGSLAFHNRELWLRYIYSPIHSHADGLVMGLLVAHLQLSRQTNVRMKPTSIWLIPLAFITCLSLQRINSVVFDFTGLAILFGALVSFGATSKSAWLGLFDNKAFYILSRLSYGMYLNHEYLHERVVAVTLRWLPFLQKTPAACEVVAIGAMVIVSAAVATVTFCAVEYPFLQLRHRLLARRERRAKSQLVTDKGFPPAMAGDLILHKELVVKLIP